MKQIVRVQIHLQALPQHSQVLLEAPTEQLHPQANRELLLVPAVSLAFVPVPVSAPMSVSAPYREQALVLVPVFALAPVLALVPTLVLVPVTVLALVTVPVSQPVPVPRSLRAPLNLAAVRLSCVCAEALAV